ncbi:NAD(P)-binding protein [Conexibacter stalactiti]|uniref:FAD-dependent oxidoreductase n=1 Tax=Conexibacter stalactiti TaxID=1940611 RepID=A0ABU4HZ08_9ACTN|nr:NAD(P)-binding protein [Conexibacter stalactiti]MDW5598540.1 FAD-dependent oxidoreductase [Conexibacter stalactiti]MEC5039182.1 NAD(P)-binding protein [Conexibacter stalactiti]
MSARIVVAGGGIGGLACALLLARAGHEVTVVERDASRAVAGGDEAFAAWERPSVRQWALVHNFSARSRGLLAERLPDVLQRLRDDGVEEVNPLALLLAPERQRPDDERLTGLLCRRPAFELALRRAVEAQAGLTVRVATVAGLEFAEEGPGAAGGVGAGSGDAGSPPHVRGVRLSDGETLAADLVVDAGGRRTRVPAWLAETGIELPTAIQPCELTYHSRYYRAAPGVRPDYLGMPRGDLGHLFYWTFVGDHGTYGAAIGAPPWEPGYLPLRDNAAWEALTAAIPPLAAWMEAAGGEPLHDVQVMANNRNLRRRYVVDGRPLVTGLVAIGDALAATNPMRAWGAAMALTHACAVADVVGGAGGGERRGARDAAATALAYDAAVAEETDLVYEVSAAADRIRTHRWKGLPIPASDARAAEEEELLQHGLLPAIGSEPELLRALLRSMGLVDRPDALFADPAVLARAREERARRDPAASAPAGPGREETLALLAGIAPAAGVSREEAVR